MPPLGLSQVQLDTRIDSIQGELERVKVELVEKQRGDSSIDDKLKMNMVIIGLKETKGENIVKKVNNVIKKGMKQEVVVNSATRKESSKKGRME